MLADLLLTFPAFKGLGYGFVVPASRGYDFLGGYHIFGVVLYHSRCFDRSHKAGVEAYDVKFIFELGALQRGFKLGESEGVKAVVLVKAYALCRAAAVIPQNEHIVLGRIFFLSPFEKVSERIRFTHIFLTEIFEQR